MSGKAGRGSEQFMVRLPDGMRDRIKAAAEANNRSMNMEIVEALERAFPPPLTADEVALQLDKTLAFIDPQLRQQVYRVLARRIK